MTFQLKVSAGPQTGKLIVLQPGEAVTAGRTRGTVLFPEDAAMSGLHFEIRRDGEKIGLKNHSQSNGTWVNGKRCESTLLQPGDTIFAGDTQFILTALSDDTASLPRVQHWLLKEIPRGWEIVAEQGLRHGAEGSYCPTVLMSEDRLPNGYDLDRYLETQLKLISERLRNAEAAKMVIEIKGSDASGGLNIRTVFPDGRVALQKQLYAVRESKVAIVTATVMQSDPASIHESITQILAAAVFEPA